MPYPGITDPEMISKMDSCVKEVMGKGNDKESAIAICHDSIMAGKEVSILPEGVSAADLLQAVEDSLTAEETQAIDRLYQDVASGKVALASLPDPETATGKAMVNLPRGGNSGGGPGGNPSGGSQGYHADKQERCFMRVKKLGADDATARKVCHSMFGGRAGIKEARHYRKCEKAITDAPGLRGDSQQSCANCNFFKWLPHTDTTAAMPSNSMMVESSPVNIYENKGICTKYEFETDGGWVCDSWKPWEPKGATAVESKEAFTVYKQADGRYRWLAVTSSSFQDRDKEIVSQKALESDTQRMNTSGNYGTLDWWHTPIVLGACDFSAMHGRLSVESGTFRDAWIAEKVARGEYEMSRAFYHPITEPDAQGVYHNIKTFSRALIPRGKGQASNLLTTFAVVEKEKQMLTDKIKELKALFGGNQEASQKVDALLAEAEQKEKQATEAGIAAKEQKPEAPAPEPEKTKETPIAEQPGMFVADMKPEEFDAHIATAINAAVKPLLDQLAELKEANAVAVKESSANVLAAALVEIKKLQDAQAQTAAQVKELNGLTPRGFRASQAESTVTKKETTGPGADEQAPYFASFVNKILGQPTPPTQ